MAAERLLEQKQRELFAANEELSRHALALSDEIIEKREEVETVRHEAEELRGEKQQVLEDLEHAHQEMEIAQKRLWHSLETIRDGFAVFGADDRLIVANPAYLSIFDGLEMIAPGISYAQILRLMAEEGIVDTEGRSREDWCAFMLGRRRRGARGPHTIKLWDRRFIRLVDRRTDTGDTVSLAADITETIRRENELKEALLQAEAANRAKSAFLAKMSHELRTPMNGVVGMADLLAETPLDEEQQLFVETIRSSGESLLGLINDVLDFSKMEAGKLTLHAEPFDLERTLCEVLMLFHPALATKEVELVVDYDMFLPTRFVGDPGRIRQVLTNLIGNAVKFTETGHVLVRVVGQPARGAGYRVHVSVEDTGPGIPEDKIDHVFGEFNQVEDEKNRKYEGTGLGLAITRQLITLMGGEIWVDSVLGEGSNFGFWIPMEAVDPAGEPPLRGPDWLRRALLICPPGAAAEVLDAQLRTLGAEVLALPPGTDLAEAAPREGDVILRSAGEGDAVAQAVIATRDRLAPGVPVVLMQPRHGAGGQPQAPGVVAVARPVSRRALIQTLQELEGPDAGQPPLAAPEPEGRGEPDKPAGPPEAAAAGPVPGGTAGGGAEMVADGAEADVSDDSGDGMETPAPETGAQRSRAGPPVAAPEHEADAALQEAGAGAPGPEQPAQAGAAATGASEGLPAPEDAQPPAAGSPGQAVPVEPRRMRILAAEDNRTNRLVFSKLVKALNIELEFAENGLEAVEKWREFRPDLVFMDISMPMMDGKEATGRIRAAEAGENLPRTPIVALTAHALSGDDQEFMAAGLDHYLTKPLKKDLIFERIREATPPGVLPVFDAPGDTAAARPAGAVSQAAE